eukprot:NODE_520_length_7308_cov_0.176862.p6 type:complete len:110 gc:universal NODE_520_length_7308_cov_0.176862:3537-3208(-)
MVVAISNFFNCLLYPNQPQPLPCTATAFLLNSLIISSMLPNDSLIDSTNFPLDGFLLLATGVKLVQKIEWFKCPPPLNFKADCSAICAVMSPFACAASKLFSALFRFVT